MIEDPLILLHTAERQLVDLFSILELFGHSVYDPRIDDLLKKCDASCDDKGQIERYGSIKGESWKESDDFEVGWDFNYCYHVCGGIYADRILCPEYLHALLGALGAAPKPDKWTYHTACETDTYDGEFFVRDGSVYLSSQATFELLKRLEYYD